jgi:lysozyme family protein
MKNFDKVIPWLLKDEGGLTNDPDDHGGLTNFGITQKETSIDVRTMTVDQAKAIYRKKYWDALGCDDLPAGVDYTCFDYGVNSGLGRPRKALQRFKSLKGTELIDAINNERVAFLKALSEHPGQKKFLRGWLARVDRVRSRSKDLAKDTTSGPIAGVAAGTSVWYTFSNYIHLHPYISVASAVTAAALVWFIIHSLRNK